MKLSYVPLERLIDKAGGSMYKLVILIARRALALAEGAPRLVEAEAGAKVTTIAMQEVADGKVFLTESEQDKKAG